MAKLTFAQLLQLAEICKAETAEEFNHKLNALGSFHDRMDMADESNDDYSESAE